MYHPAEIHELHDKVTVLNSPGAAAKLSPVLPLVQRHSAALLTVSGEFVAKSDMFSFPVSFQLAACRLSQVKVLLPSSCLRSNTRDAQQHSSGQVLCWYCSHISSTVTVGSL